MSSLPHHPRRHVAEVLLRHWDPLLLSGRPEGDPEREAYTEPVCDLVFGGASPRAIAEHLVTLETRSLGFQDSEWRMLVPLARRLRSLARHRAG